MRKILFSFILPFVLVFISIHPLFGREIIKIKNLDLDTLLFVFRIETQHERTIARGDKEGLQKIFKAQGYNLSEEIAISFSAQQYWELEDNQYAQNYIIKKNLLGYDVFVQPPWWDYLFLEVQGQIETAFMADALRMNVSIYYENNLVKKYPFFLSDVISSSENGIFEKRWGALNQATQSISPGVYKIKWEFLWSEQAPVFQEKWKKRFGTFAPMSEEKLIRMGSKKDSEEYRRKSQGFYISQIKILNGLYLNLKTQEQKIIQRYTSKNRVPVEIWEKWIKTFYQKIEQEQKTLHSYTDKNFPLCYPQTQGALLAYCRILFRLARSSQATVQRIYQLNLQERYLDPDATHNLHMMEQHIRNLHNKCAREMRMDLVAKLGYNPPPQLSSQQK